MPLGTVPITTEALQLAEDVYQYVLKNGNPKLDVCTFTLPLPILLCQTEDYYRALVRKFGDVQIEEAIAEVCGKPVSCAFEFNYHFNSSKVKSLTISFTPVE